MTGDRETPFHGERKRPILAFPRGGRRADVDLDNGAFHKSPPRDVYKNFQKRFTEGAKIYKVK